MTPTRLMLCNLAAASLWFSSTTGASAQTGNAVLDLLVRKGVITEKEAEETQAQADKETAKAVEANSKLKIPSVVKALDLYGDLRMRAEYFGVETGPDVPTDDWRYMPPTDDRLRFRGRARIGANVSFPDWGKLGVRLTTSPDRDPVSTNQTFQDTFTKKEVYFDAFFAQLTPPWANWFSVTVGKMNNPIWQPHFASPMEYDFDITPEGLAEQINFKFGPKEEWRLFANFLQAPLDEIAASPHDPMLYDFQGGVEAHLGAVEFTAAGGAYFTQSVGDMGIQNSGLPSASASPNRGNLAGYNPLVGGTTYADDFTVAYGRADLAWTFSQAPFLGTPCVLTFSGEYMKNLGGRFEDSRFHDTGIDVESPDETEGYTGQVAFGRAKKAGEWQLAYQYKHLEADATWDAITDSDWGYGGTDRRGHVVKLAYNVREWWQLGFAGFVTQKISNRPSTGNNARGIEGEDMLRVQVDSVFKF